MLKIEQLTKKFGHVTAVDEVSFEVDAGEIFTLIGPNGSGKTTIIRLIAGLLRPTGGTISLDEADVVANPMRTKARIGYIPDDPTAWHAMTGEEFLHFTGALYNVSADERTRRIPELLDIFDLRGIEKGYFHDYSRGNKQKFTILAALLHKPDVLLIDEPIVGLDPVSAQIAKKKIKEFADAGGAVLMATHTLSAAQDIASHIGVLTAGRLSASGRFEELRQHAGLSEGARLEEIYNALAT